jgi:hypothetical protein
MMTSRCYACHMPMQATASGACDLCTAVIRHRRDVALLVIKLGCRARPLWRPNQLAEILGIGADSIVSALGAARHAPLDIDAALGLPPGSFGSAVQSQIAVLRAQRGLIAARG